MYSSPTLLLEERHVVLGPTLLLEERHGVLNTSRLCGSLVVSGPSSRTRVYTAQTIDVDHSKRE